MPKLSEKQRKRYKRRGGGYCPFCESTDILGGSLDFIGGRIEQRITCQECGEHWWNIYRIIGLATDED